MHASMTTPETPGRIAIEAYHCMMEENPATSALLTVKDVLDDIRLPLPNVWLGVRVEQRAALNRPRCTSPASSRCWKTSRI